MGDNDFLILVVLAALAGFLLLRLRNVLGERGGFEDPDRYLRKNDPSASANGGDSNVVTPFPKQNDSQDDADIFVYAEPNSDLGQGLKSIKNADRSFLVGEFMEGGRGAYEMLLTAFESGDKATLKPFLSDEVYAAFSQAIDDRNAQNLSVDMRFVGFRSAEPVEASFDRSSRRAEISVRFVAEVVSATRNAQGEIVEGDPAAVRKLTDIWTFARIVGAADPNWTLVATGG